MPVPATPGSVDGAGLDADQMTRLTDLIRVIYAPDPTRDSAAILTQAISAFRRMYQRDGDVWQARSVIQLGTSEADAVLIIR